MPLALETAISAWSFFFNAVWGRQSHAWTCVKHGITVEHWNLYHASFWLWCIHHRGQQACFTLQWCLFESFQKYPMPKTKTVTKGIIDCLIIKAFGAVHWKLLAINVTFIISLFTILLGFLTFHVYYFLQNIGVSLQTIIFHCPMAILWSNILMNANFTGVRKKSSKQFLWIQKITPYFFILLKTVVSFVRYYKKYMNKTCQRASYLWKCCLGLRGGRHQFPLTCFLYHLQCWCCIAPACASHLEYYFDKR